MLVSRFFTSENGGSQYDNVEIPLASQTMDRWGNLTTMSERFTSPGVCIFEIAEGSFQDWHNAPQRQLCVVLNGVWEVETSDGERRSWKPGELFLPDDVKGKGHISRVLQGPVRILFVPFESDFDMSHWLRKANSI